MAAFFWIHAGANSNWNTVNNWSATSGGVTNAATPSVTSDVTFDGAGANGNDASVISASQSVLSLTFTSGYTSSVTINAALTIAGNFTDNTAHTWAGTFGLTMSATCTIASGGKTFPNAVSFTGGTKTLGGGNNWTISGALTIGGTTTLNLTTAESLNCSGLVINSALSGTASVYLKGGTLSGGQILSCSIFFDGNVTTSGSLSYNTGTIKYLSGIITTTSATLTVGAGVTFDTVGMVWNILSFTGSVTTTINSTLSANTANLSNGVGVTFNGTAGFIIGTFNCNHTTANATQTLKNGITYTITTAFNCFQTRIGSTVSFTSDDGTLKANLTLNNGASCNVLANFTRIDASGGRAIWTFNGTVTSCINIISLTDLSFVTGRSQVVQGNSNF